MFDEFLQVEMTSEIGFLEWVMWRGFWGVLGGMVKEVVEGGVSADKRMEEVAR